MRQQFEGSPCGRAQTRRDEDGLERGTLASLLPGCQKRRRLWKPSAGEARERASRLGYRLEKVKGEDRWLRYDRLSGRLAGGSRMTRESLLAWLVRSGQGGTGLCHGKQGE